MKKIIQAVVAVVVILSMTGCATTKAYFIDRGRDARDILNLGVETGSFGASAQAGPIMTGAIYTDLGSADNGWGIFYRGFGSYSYGDLQIVIAGFKGGESHNERGIDGGTLQVGTIANGIFPFGWSDGFSSKRDYYSLGNIEVRVGLGVGLHAGINLGELADFFLGWFGIDFMNDDIEAKKLSEKLIGDSEPHR